MIYKGKESKVGERVKEKKKLSFYHLSECEVGMNERSLSIEREYSMEGKPGFLRR